jgi:hypothetical protein
VARLPSKVVDLYTGESRRRRTCATDIWFLARILYDAVRGREHYAKQPTEIKEICLGSKRSLT